jgi:hypothetical protein
MAASIYANLREVQEYMGHASVTTTELYAHFVPRLDAAARGTAGLAAMLAAGEPRTENPALPVSATAGESVHPTVHRTTATAA